MSYKFCFCLFVLSPLDLAMEEYASSKMNRGNSKYLKLTVKSLITVKHAFKLFKRIRYAIEKFIKRAKEALKYV